MGVVQSTPPRGTVSILQVYHTFSGRLSFPPPHDLETGACARSQGHRMADPPPESALLLYAALIWFKILFIFNASPYKGGEGGGKCDGLFLFFVNLIFNLNLL